MSTRGIWTVVLLLAFGSPGPTWAQDEAGVESLDDEPTGTEASGAGANQVSADELAQQGRQAYQAGNWKQAIDFYQRAESLEHSAEYLLYWARAAEKLGKLVQARENYQAVIDDADESDEVDQMKQEAQTALDVLEPRLPWVTIVVKGADIDTEVQVTVDGVPLMPGTLSVKQPIDPGTHEFRTRAGKSEGKPVTATFTEGQHQEVALELPVAEKPNPLVRREPAQPLAEREPEPEPSLDDTSTPPSSGGPGLRMAGYAGLGLGVVGLTVGTIFGIKTNSKNDDIRTACGDVNRCPRDIEPDVKRLQDDAKSSGTLATIGFVVGGVGLAAGGALLVLSMDGGSDPSVDAAHAERQPSLSAWLGPQSLGLRGTF